MTNSSAISDIKTGDTISIHSHCIFRKRKRKIAVKRTHQKFNVNMCFTAKKVLVYSKRNSPN